MYMCVCLYIPEHMQYVYTCFPKKMYALLM